jgi:hypothetical protein
MTEKYIPENSTASFLKVIAFIVGIAGVVSSLILGNSLAIVEIAEHSWEEPVSHYNWSVAISGICLSAVTCLFIYAFGEVINLLQRNLDAQNALAAQLRQPEEPKKSED